MGRSGQCDNSLAQGARRNDRLPEIAPSLTPALESVGIIVNPGPVGTTDGTWDVGGRMGNDDEEAPRPRVEEPNRKRGEIRFEIPEDTWPPTHPARVLWNVRGTLDLGTF